MEMLVYSQDTTYSTSLTESKTTDDNDMDCTVQNSLPKRRVMYFKDNHATLQELMVHLKSYYKVGSKLKKKNLSSL